MSDEIIAEEINAFTTNMANMLDQSSRQVRRGIDSIGSSLQRVADGLMSSYNQLMNVFSPGGGGSGAGGAAGSAGGSGGRGTGQIQLVRVVNTNSQMIPVRIVEGGRESGGRRRGGILGGIGSFFGGLFGGIVGGVVGGIAMPLALVTAIGELVAALALAIPLVRNARRLVGDLRQFGNAIINGIGGLITMLFDRFTAAGIFPVSRFITSLLVFIDYGLTLILRHIQPVIEWLMELLRGLNVWIGNLLSEVGRFLARVLNQLPAYLAQLIDYLVEGVLRPALGIVVDDIIRALAISLTGVAYGFAFAIGEVFMEAGRWLAGTLHREFVLVINEIIRVFNQFLRVFERGLSEILRILSRVIPGVPSSVRLGSISTLGVPGAPGDLGARLASAVPAAYQRGRTAGRSAMSGLMGAPAPARTVAPPTAPTFGAPGFNVPEMNLHEYPEIRPILRDLIQRELGEREPASARVGRPAEASTPVTFNGGVNVQITAESIDRENAQATARRIAENVMEEIQRLNQRDRFRRGLSTSSIV